jgi:hypothetical protein
VMVHAIGYTKNGIKILKSNKNKRKRKDTHKPSPTDHAKLRRQAYDWLYYSKKSGKIIPHTRCAHCGRFDRKITAHHIDIVNDFKNILWLCRPCHDLAHGYGIKTSTKKGK